MNGFTKTISWLFLFVGPLAILTAALGVALSLVETDIGGIFLSLFVFSCNVYGWMMAIENISDLKLIAALQKLKEQNDDAN